MSCAQAVHPSPEISLEAVAARLGPARIIGEVSGIAVTSVTYDHRSAGPGALHCCFKGDHVDGHDFAPAALRAGAVAFVCERPLEAEAAGAVQLVVGPGRARPAMARAACALYGDPALSLWTVGVTGTNGKTTTTYFLRSVLEEHGWPTSVIGTLGGARTTPEAPELQRALAHARDSGRSAAALEVSSHALVQHRLDGYRHDVAVFTNLSQDHLDYHLTMEAYFAAKAQLFTPEHAKKAVVNGDDPYGRRLLETAAIPTSAFFLAEAEELRYASRRAASAWAGRASGSGRAGRSTSPTRSPQLRPPGNSACPRRRSPPAYRSPPVPPGASRRCPTTSVPRSWWTTPIPLRASRRSSTPRAPKPGRAPDG